MAMRVAGDDAAADGATTEDSDVSCASGGQYQ